MKATEAQRNLFQDLVAELPDQHRAEFFRNLHEAGISPNDVELARLLRALQLYKAYYETIPGAVQKAAAEIERLKREYRAPQYRRARQLRSRRAARRPGHRGSGTSSPRKKVLKVFEERVKG